MVDALGQGVDSVEVGDEVLGWSDTGSYAQYALATTVAPQTRRPRLGYTRSRFLWPVKRRNAF